MDKLNVDAEIERRTIRNLADMVREFYKDPENRKAYEVWKQSEAAKPYLAYINS